MIEARFTPPLADPAKALLSAADIVALTVTYGRRIALVRLCVQSLERLGIPRLVIVTNGVDAGYKAELETLKAEASLAITMVHLGKNVGAGGGFAAAIRHARAEFGDQYLWLLDDDNCPRPGALDALRHAAKQFEPLHALVAFTSLRGERFPLWLTAAKTGQGEGVFYRKSSISSLDVRRIPEFVLKRLRRSPPSLPLMADVDSSPEARGVDIPGGPYGGFFIHSRHIDVIGYPDERFVLYFDDLEWTNRVRRHGGHVVLVPGCVVDDAEGDWAAGDAQAVGKSRFFMIDLLRSDSPKRLYYSTRNNIYFKSRYWSDGWAITAANVTMFVTLAVGLGLILRRPRNAWTMVTAAFDGVTGRLGGSL
jgi:GT2 family glycosyltransferase